MFYTKRRRYGKFTNPIWLYEKDDNAETIFGPMDKLTAVQMTNNSDTKFKAVYTAQTFTDMGIVQEVVLSDLFVTNKLSLRKLKLLLRT